EPRHLPDYLRNVVESSPKQAPTPDETYAGSAPVAGVATAAKSASDNHGLFFPLGHSLEDVLQAYTLATLQHCQNNKTQAAKLLGISRKTLHDRLSKWKN